MRGRKRFFFEKKNQKTFELNENLAKSRHARAGGHPRLFSETTIVMRIYLFIATLFLSGAAWLFLTPSANAASTIPFVGCPTDADWGHVIPTGQPIAVKIPANVAAKLALYAGVNGLGILAPRGWKCSGGEAVGGTGIIVYPPNGSLDKAPMITISFAIDNSGGTSWLSQYAYYFPRIVSMQSAMKYAADTQQSPSQYIFKQYSTDTLKYLSDSAFEFVTPAHQLGLGDLVLSVSAHRIKPSSFVTYGMIGISFEDGTNLVALVMQMPQSLSYLHSYINQFAEGCFLKVPNCLSN